MKRLWILAALAIPSLAGAAEVSLGRGIPSDSFIYMRRQATAELGFLAPSLEKTGKACREALLADDSLRFLFDLLGQKVGKPEAAQWRKLLESIEWEKLAGKEWAFGARFEISILDNRSLDSTSRFDWIALFRVDAAERDRILRGIRSLVRHFTTLEEKSDLDPGEKTSFEAIDSDRDGAPVTILATPLGESRLCVGGQGDVIAVASSGWQMRRAFQLLAGEGSGLGLNESEDYARLMKGLPAAESGELVFRPGLIFDHLRDLSAAVGEASVRNPKAVRDLEDVVQGLKGIVDTLDIVNGIAISETVEGRRLVETFRIELQEDASKRILYPAFFDRPPLGSIDRMVPRSAWGFAATSGIDVLKLHEGLLEAMKKVSADGRLLADEYIRLQGKAGLDVEEDILSLFDGRAVVLAFPAAAAPGAPVPVPGDGQKTEPKDKPESAKANEKENEKDKDKDKPGEAVAGGRVVLIGLKEPDRAEARLDEWVTKGGDSLRGLGLGLEKVEIPGATGNFRRLVLPFPPGLEITFGVSGGQLCLANSRLRLAEALRVKKGEIEGIVESPAYRSVENSPEGDPGLVSFVDLQEFFRMIRATIREVGPMAAMIPDDSEGGLGSLKKALGFGAQLDRVLSTLDFTERFGGWLSRDGKAFRGKFVVTLRPPGAAPPAASGDEKKTPAGETKRGTF